MITLALFQKMAEERVAGLKPNRNFFWEEAPLQREGRPAHGVWIITRGGDASRSHRKLNLRTTVDFYVAFGNKPKIEKIHAAILDWIVQNRCICELTGQLDDGEDRYDWDFRNVRMSPTTTPQNDGITDNGLLVKVASALVIYDDNN